METKRKLYKSREAFNDKFNLFESPIVDFANLGAIPIGDLLDLIRKFQSFLKTKGDRELVKDHLPEFQYLNKEVLRGPEVALKTTHFCLVYEPKLKIFEAVYPGKIQQVTLEGNKGQKQALGFMLKRHFPKMCFKTLLYFQRKDPLCIRVKTELEK